MLDRLVRLQFCRLLALLATLLLASVGPHVHAATAVSATSVAMAEAVAQGDTADHSGNGAMHCGVCHAARAVMPHPADANACCSVIGQIVAPGIMATLEGLHGQVPSRPPRGMSTG